MSRRSIPHRLRDRAKKTGRLAGVVAAAGARRLVRKRVSDDRLFGEVLVGELDSMKGMAMKVGQILSYMDGTLPAETQRVLRRLQRGAEPIAWQSVADQVLAGLGSPVDELYDHVDHEPIAAASIGQVHRAAVNGLQVAVKVQYPNVRATFDADLKQMRRIARLATLATHVDGLAIVTDIQDRLLEECDYTFEARWLAMFAERFADCPDVALMRFAMRSLYVHGAINADPHPGNYLFATDGRVTFLDFGCVRELTGSWLQHDRAVVLAVLSDDHDAFERAVIASAIIAGPVHKFDFDAHWLMVSWELQPYLVPDFHFTLEYTKQGAQYSNPSNSNLRRMNIEPEWIWVERLRIGLHAVIARLDARGDLRHILREALDLPSLNNRNVA